VSLIANELSKGRVLFTLTRAQMRAFTPKGEAATIVHGSGVLA
jgi:hypothetical protein